MGLEIRVQGPPSPNTASNLIEGDVDGRISLIKKKTLVGFAFFHWSMEVWPIFFNIGVGSGKLN